jgi:hypothetical protein
VDKAEVQAILDKYDPLEKDRKEYVAAKRAGKLEEYWQRRAALLQEITGSPVVPAAEPRPPLPAAAAAAGGQQHQQQQQQLQAQPVAA